MPGQNEDQAKRLREQFEKPAKTNDTTSQEKSTLDVLALPPRGDVHEEKQSKLRFKVSYALVRLLAILFILIVVLILTYNYWGSYFLLDGKNPIIQANASSEEVLIDAEHHQLSQIVTKTVYLEEDGPGEVLTGRFYLTQGDETLIHIIDRFYPNLDQLKDVEAINDLTASDIILEKNLRLFLPNVD